MVLQVRISDIRDHILEIYMYNKYISIYYKR